MDFGSFDRQCSRLAWPRHIHSQSNPILISSHSFPVEPTPDTLSFYAIYMAHYIKPNLVSSYLLGICNQLERQENINFTGVRVELGDVEMMISGGQLGGI